VSSRALHELVTEDRVMLGYSVRDLARLARVPLVVLWYIAKNPQFLPRLEYVRRICEVLLVSLQHLRDGSGYGKEFIPKRLMRYFDLGFDGYTMSDITTDDEAVRLSVLQCMEAELRKHHNLPPRNS